MWFYIMLGSLFSVYALDMLWLVVVATIARSHEAVEIIKQYRADNPDAPVTCGCVPKSMPPLSKRRRHRRERSGTSSMEDGGSKGGGSMELGGTTGDDLTVKAAEDAELDVQGDKPKEANSHGEHRVAIPGLAQTKLEAAKVHPIQSGHMNALHEEDANGLQAPEGVCHQVVVAELCGQDEESDVEEFQSTGTPTDDELAMPVAAAKHQGPAAVPQTVPQTIPLTAVPQTAFADTRIAANANGFSSQHEEAAQNLHAKPSAELAIQDQDPKLLRATAISKIQSLPSALESLPSTLTSTTTGSQSSTNSDGFVDPKQPAARDGTACTAVGIGASVPPPAGLPTNPLEWPKVLIQLPMYNEEAHCDLIVQHCCKIRWPKERLLIQVLDDSTRQEIRTKVDTAVLALIEEGHPVQVMRRDNRQGYKAGAMVEGLAHLKEEAFEYAAIFDADFEPPEDFLEDIIPALHVNRNLAFVQTRWLSPSNSFLTWAQRINLDFHFDVEQRARSYLGWFFNFNGTAGVWRIAAIEDAGGWESDTVVEDMDLSLRCYLNGWSALYMDHVHSPNELPSTLSSYKTQQFRWLSGPMQILVKCFMLIWRAQKISFWKRLNCYWFFARYILFAAITFGVLSVPPVVLWVDPWHWEAPQIFYMVSINFALAVYLYITPWSLPYLLFSVTIGYFKAHAMMSGLIGAEKSKKWKVTQKFGSSGSGFSWRNMHKPYGLELLLSIYYGAMGIICCLAANWMLGGYCIIMCVLFLALSFGDYFL